VTTTNASQRRIHQAIEGSDNDELLRIVEGLCATYRWQELLELRLLLADAVTRGKQVWGVDGHIRYRLALEAPPELAAAAVLEGPARFALGPLTEVVANRHTFAELDPFLTPGPERTLVAHERVIGRERIEVEQIDPHVLDLPLYLMDWEPIYSRPEYKADRVESHPPDLPAMQAIDLPETVPEIEDLEATTALLALVSPWVEESNGRAQVTCVQGDALSAIRALGPARALFARIDAGLALGLVQWAAASGGAEGRRRGGAAGRFSTWYAIASLGDLEWPTSPESLGDVTEGLRWIAWSDLAPPTGWNLNLAVEDRTEGLAWAITAVDSA
jgi:hypothetical protein